MRKHRTFVRRFLRCIFHQHILVRPTGFEPAAFRVGVSRGMFPTPNTAAIGTTCNPWYIYDCGNIIPYFKAIFNRYILGASRYTCSYFVRIFSRQDKFTIIGYIAQKIKNFFNFSKLKFPNLQLFGNIRFSKSWYELLYHIFSIFWTILKCAFTNGFMTRLAAHFNALHWQICFLMFWFFLFLVISKNRKIRTFWAKKRIPYFKFHVNYKN